MIFNIISTPNFEKEVKKLVKKYPSLKNNLFSLKKQLLDDPFLGTSLGKDCYKIRLAITSKGKGKSGGARIITCVRVMNENIHLLSIYDKSEKGDISSRELKKLLASV